MAVSFFIAILTTSCVRDTDFDECEFPLRLQFSYTYNRENRDLLLEEVSTISLRLFDAETGELVKTKTITVNDLDSCSTYVWEAPRGNYNLVTWGGIEDRYKIDNDQHIDNHRLRLPSDEGSNVEHKREHLWHNLKSDIRIDGYVSPTYFIDIRKISNDVTVSIDTKDGSNLTAPVETRVYATNDLYTASGSLHPDAKEITYIPQVEEEASKSIHSYTTLGLGQSDGSKLTVKYGDSTVYNGGLTDLIAKKPGIIFGLDDDFHLDFEVESIDDGSIAVNISVDGWLIVSMDVSLE